MTALPLDIAVLIYPGCTIVEVAEAATRLRNAGAHVSFVASTDAEFEDQSGLWMRAHHTFDQLGSRPLAAVIVPGGDALSVFDDEDAHSFLSTQAAAGTLIAGICAGVLVLGRVGLLGGRRITHNYRAPWAPDELQEFAAPHFAGSDVTQDPTVGVVVDDNIITALPNAAVEFAMTICELLEIYTAEQADMIGRHLRGDYVADLYTP